MPFRAKIALTVGATGALTVWIIDTLFSYWHFVGRWSDYLLGLIMVLAVAIVAFIGLFLENRRRGPLNEAETRQMAP